MGLFDGVSSGAGHMFGEITGSNRLYDQSKHARRDAEFHPWDINTSYGSATFDSAGRVASAEFTPEFQAYLDSMRNTSQGLMSQDGVLSPNQETATNELYGLLSSMAQPGETQALNSLENRLFARGMLGSTGGAEQLGQFRDALSRADMGRQVQAYQLGTDAANSAANRQYMGANIGGMFGSLQSMSLQDLLAGANIGGMQAQAGANQGMFRMRAAEADAANRSEFSGNVMDAISNAAKFM